MSTRPFEVKFCDSWKGYQVMGCVWGLFPGGDFSPFKRFTSLSCSECQGLYMSKNYPVLLTQSSESCWSNQLHQLVVAHVSQQVLQASFSSECGEFVAAAASAACRSGNGRVVQVLVHLTAELLILVSLWLLTEIERARILWNQSWILHRPNYQLFLSGDTRPIIQITKRRQISSL